MSEYFNHEQKESGVDAFLDRAVSATGVGRITIDTAREKKKRVNCRRRIVNLQKQVVKRISEHMGFELGSLR